MRSVQDNTVFSHVLDLILVNFGDGPTRLANVAECKDARVWKP
jgi:hypothetical protein